MNRRQFNLRLDERVRARLQHVMEERPYLGSMTAAILYVLDLGLRDLEANDTGTSPRPAAE